MSDNYKFDINTISEVATFSADMESELINTLKTAEVLKGKIESYSGWQGQQREELMAFLSLLTQYHRDLIEANDAPFKQYAEAFEELINNIDGYRGDSRSFKELVNR